MDPVEQLDAQQDNGAEAQIPLRYLHPVSLIFDLLAHARSYLLPIIFGLLGAANGNVGWLIVSAVLFVPAVTSSVIRYFTLKYRIEDAHLVVDQGLLFRKTRTIPVDRIQNIDLTQNVLHRICGVAEVKVETASGSEAEATLRVLSLEQVEALRSGIFRSKKAAAGHTEATNLDSGQADIDGLDDGRVGDGSIATKFSDTPNETKLIWTIPVWDLAKAGLASSRGLVLIGIAFGAVFQFGDNSYQSIFRWVSRFFPENDGTIAYYFYMAAVALAALALLRLMGIGWYILRFYGYRLTQCGADLRIACGLLTKVSATIPRNRIQFISVQQNLIMRWMRIATIRLETAGGANDQTNPTESVAKSWFMPVIPVDDVPQIMALLRPGLSWDETKFEYSGLSPRAASRFTRLAIVESILVSGVAGWFYWPWGLLAGLLVLPLLVLWARKKAASRKYARTNDSVIYRSGVFARKTSVAFFEKIQAVTCVQTPFDRRWSMATLTVDTAAAGPAEHRITTAYLDHSFAAAEFEAIRRVAVDPQLAETA